MTYTIISNHGLAMDVFNDLEKAKRYCDLWFNAGAVISEDGDVVYRKYAGGYDVGREIEAEG